MSMLSERTSVGGLRVSLIFCFSVGFVTFEKMDSADTAIAEVHFYSDFSNSNVKGTLIL